MRVGADREAAEAVERLEAVTDTALAELSLDALLDELLARVRRILAADTAAILLLEDDALAVRVAKGLEEAGERSVCVPLGKGFAGRVAAEKRPIAIEDVDYADVLNPVLREKRIRSLLGVPILFEGRVIGVLHVGTVQVRRFRPADAQLLQVVADRIGLGIAYAHLYEEEKRAHARAEADQRRNGFLANVSNLLSSTLDYEQTLRNLARLAVPELGDWCVIDMRDGRDGLVRRVAVAHVDPARESLVWEIERRYPARPEDPYSPARVVATGRSELVPEVTDAIAVAAARNAEHLAMIRQLELVSYMSVPLIARGRTLGAMSLATARSGRRYRAADLAFAEELASRAALAVDNARLYREAQEASRLKDEFLATLSHELRTPVTGVLGWMWMLRRAQLDEAAAARALETMERSMRSLLRIIDDLLDVSRAIRGQLRLEPKPVGLVAVVEAAVEAIRLAANAKDIQLETAVDLEVGFVQGDPERLQQVVWNLLTNAIKFTPTGGRVQVRLERAGSSARIRVSDTGVGVPREFLPHVFERFRQADAGSTRLHGGLGLGLAIVRHIVELHGGSVEVDSPGPDQGATFTVTLPIIAAVRPAGDAVSTRPAPAEASTPVLDGVRVLVVDDEADTRSMLTALLTRSGAGVRGSAFVGEALEVLRSWRPHVIVCDLAMPGEDGYALLRRLRALAPGEEACTPVLALTAYARVEDRHRALEAGFQEYLAKPFDPPALVAAIARLAETHWAKQEQAAPDRQRSERAVGRRAGRHARTILVVEDDPGAREYTCAVLRQNGYRVLPARTGEEAVRVWSAQPDEIDVVVTDLVMMPGSSGVKVSHTVHQQRAGVPVIVLTGYPHVAEMLDPRREGVVECLQKPIEPEDLAAAVDRALSHAPAQ